MTIEVWRALPADTVKREDSTMFGWLRRKRKRGGTLRTVEYRIDVYPNSSSCIRQNMNHVRPQQLPPLMVRKAAWRR